MSDLPPVDSTQWDALLDEALLEARRVLHASPEPEDANDAAYLAGTWVAYGELVVERQRNELAFEKWRERCALEDS